jgi:ABC-type nitrate/sulfonate/bicarbonate transport system permease component
MTSARNPTLSRAVRVPSRGRAEETPQALRRHRLVVLALRLLLIVLAICAWQAVVATGAVSTSAVAAPTAVVAEVGPLAVTGSFWSALWSTVATWAIGLVIATVVAVPAGLLLGSSRIAYRLSRFTMDFLRTIPPIALVPLVLLIFGATERMALILVVFGSAGSLLLPTMYGAQHVEPLARDVARGYRLRRRDSVWHILIPSAMPFIATGLRVSATISLLLTIGAELIGGAPGLGDQISIDQQSSHIPEMYAYIVVCAALGAILNLAMARLERRVIRWSPSHR